MYVAALAVLVISVERWYTQFGTPRNISSTWKQAFTIKWLREEWEFHFLKRVPSRVRRGDRLKNLDDGGARLLFPQLFTVVYVKSIRYGLEMERWIATSICPFVQEGARSWSKLRLEEIKLNLLNVEYTQRINPNGIRKQRVYPLRDLSSGGQPIRRTNLNSFFLSLFFFPLLLKNKLDSVFNAMRGAQMVENSWQAKLASSRVEQTSWNKTTRIIRLSSNSKKADRLLYYRGKEKVKLNLCINRIKGRG